MFFSNEIIFELLDFSVKHHVSKQGEEEDLWHKIFRHKYSFNPLIILRLFLFLQMYSMLELHEQNLLSPEISTGVPIREGFL